MTDGPLGWALFLGGIALVAFSIHLWLRQIAAQTVIAGLARDASLGEFRDWVVRAFRRNATIWRPLVGRDPVGLGRSVRRRLARVLNDADRYVQDLNNRFADPSGGRAPPRAEPAPQPVAAPAPEPPADQEIKPLSTGTDDR